MITKVFKKDKKVITETAYNKDFVEFAREKKAKWDGKYWNFSEKFEKEVIEKLKEIYGEVKNGKYDTDVIYDRLIDEKATWGECTNELKEVFLKGNKKNKFTLKNGKLWYKWTLLCFTEGFKINENGNIEIKDSAVFVDFFEK